jgi:hypothetical protein
MHPYLAITVLSFVFGIEFHLMHQSSADRKNVIPMYFLLVFKLPRYSTLTVGFAFSVIPPRTIFFHRGQTRGFVRDEKPNFPTIPGVQLFPPGTEF